MPTYEAPTLETDRLVIRLARVADAPRIVAYNRRNEARLREFGPFNADTVSEVAIRRKIAAGRRAFLQGKTARFLTLEKHAPEGPIVSLITLTDAVRGPLLAANLGYSTDAAFEAKGLLSEALVAIIDWSFGPFGLHRLDAGYEPQNERSGRVLSRLGFRIEGHSPRLLNFGDGWRASVRTALDTTDWAASRPGTSRRNTNA